MTTSNQQEEKLTDAELRSLRLLGQTHYGNSLYSDHITYQHELQTLIGQLIKAREEIAERKGRTEEFNDMLKIGEEAYLGDDWWADENVHDNSAVMIPLTYIESRQAALSTNKPESQ